MKKINMSMIHKITMIIARIIEIIHWIGAVAMLLVLIGSLVAKDFMLNMIAYDSVEFGTSVTSYGFEAMLTKMDGTINGTTLIVFSLTACILLSIYAMVFRNVYLILKTAKGKTWFSKGETPFQKDIVRMLREIGIFLLVTNFAGLIISSLASIMIGKGLINYSIGLESIMIGLLMLCVSQFFDYGTRLQNDVDGLV